MATKFRLRRSATADKRPVESDLLLGELALNTYDGRLYTKRDTNNVGIADTAALLTPWTENFGGGSIYYSNSVGIGTVDPQQKLDVRGNTVIGIDQASGNPGTTVGITTIRGHHVNSDADYAQLYLSNSKSAGGGTAPTASIRAGRVSNNYGTNLSFWTNSTSSAGDGSEALRITSSGVLKLTGQSTSFETAGITHHTNNNLYIRGGTTGAILQSVDGKEAWVVQNDYVSASTDDEERLRITSAGRVGIGSEIPDYMLDVSGAINSETDVKVGGVSVSETALNDAVAMAIALG